MKRDRKGLREMNYIEELGMRAKAAKTALAAASTDQKNQVLYSLAALLREREAEILDANQKDLKAAQENGMSSAMQDRLCLNEARIGSMAAACEHMAELEDPVGEVIGGGVRPNGMQITKVRVPMGVIGIIYESRPNVTIDAGILCLKSGNAVILRGGKEAFCSNQCLVGLLREAAAQAGFSQDVVQLVERTDRETATMMMKADGCLDLLIPRGGAGLIRTVVEQATVPVIETGTGNCHVYVDESARLEEAVAIVDNGKTQRPSVCNAVESCLVHQAVAETFLPMLKAKLDEHQVELRGCDKTREILGDAVVRATEEDYATEFLDYILSIKVVADTEEAIDHIARYSTGHSECIVTESLENARTFQQKVDAAAVYVNCSTRFTDGEEFGLGAEIGISTQKLHARGPMGLRELTTMKYLIVADGLIRS
ncbi:MAG: glutamate-5-semialdehyde dehydrogenase [Lachnospiraceae bacterium]